MVYKMEALLECVHIAYTSLHADLYAQSVQINKITTLELSWKFIKVAVLVGERKRKKKIK